MAAFTVHVSEGDAPPGSVAVRREVFIDEQGVTEREEIDGLDPGCIHIVAEQDGQAVGCARLRRTPGATKVERVAVVARLRSTGLGRALMEEAEAEAERRDWRPLALHAQLASVGFYEHLGWRAEGPVFEEAGIPHRRMVR
jgi:predicted GNAT family N-acyltransferase